MKQGIKTIQTTVIRFNNNYLLCSLGNFMLLSKKFKGDF